MIRRAVRFFPALLAVFSLTVLSQASFPGAAKAAPYDYPPPWPASDVTFTVPFTQGGEMDGLFSLIRQGFEEKTGKALTARHVPGRGGAYAWARLVDDAPDGSVLTPVLFPDAYLRSLQPDSGVSPRAMAVCGVIAYMPCVLWAAGTDAVTSLDAFADAAAGMNGNFLVTGPGSYSAGQLAARMLDRELGLHTIYIPYAGTATAAKAALDGKAGAFWGYSVPVAVPGVPEELIRPLAVAAEQRLPALPDVPTFREMGIDFLLGAHIGIAVPVDTPEITRQEIDEFFTEFVKTPGFKTGAAAMGFVPLDIDMEGTRPFLREMEETTRRLAEGYDLLKP